MTNCGILQYPDPVAIMSPAQGISERVHVTIRIRPLLKRESSPIWKALPQYNAITQISSDQTPVPHSAYSYDQVFDSTHSSTDIYKHGIISNLITSALDGIHGSIFLYGI